MAAKRIASSHTHIRKITILSRLFFLFIVNILWQVFVKTQDETTQRVDFTFPYGWNGLGTTRRASWCSTPTWPQQYAVNGTLLNQSGNLPHTGQFPTAC